MNKIHYSPEARSDLVAIKDYIGVELANPGAADNTLVKITKKIHSLKQFAEIGSPLSSIIDIDSDYHFLVCGNYLVFYRVVETDIYINRVLYGKSDYLAILFSNALPDLEME
jgi:plasmid stabilization system protein ParE